MNKEFEIINNKVNIFTDDKGIIEKNSTNNIEKILITENNIEEIENDIKRILKKISLSDNKVLSYWDSILGAVLCFGFGILSNVIGIWWISTILILGSVGYLGFAINEIKAYANTKKTNKRILKELADNLEIQKNKLNELNKDKSNDLINQEKKSINTSEEIDILKRKLNIIRYYQINKSTLIKAYKKGNLNKITNGYLFNEHDTYLLEELIKNDLNIKEENIITKQKTLRGK